MKRPAAIYLLVVFYQVMLMLSLAFLVSGSAKPGTRLTFIRLLWSIGLPEFITYLIVLLYCVIFALIIWGLWKGLPLGRNLAIVVSLALMFYPGSILIKVFTVVNAMDLMGWAAAQLYIALGLAVIFAFVFYLALRPDVGRFCKVYPRA
jgi:hypothetical protein